MTPLAVVKDLDKFPECRLRMGMRLIMLVMDHFQKLSIGA
jgi:hypothetical protein